MLCNLLSYVYNKQYTSSTPSLALLSSLLNYVRLIVSFFVLRCAPAYITVTTGDRGCLNIFRERGGARKPLLAPERRTARLWGAIFRGASYVVSSFSRNAFLRDDIICLYRIHARNVTYEWHYTSFSTLAAETYFSNEGAVASRWRVVDATIFISFQL